MAGFRGLPGSGAYSASKAAAITYLESLRVELTRQRGRGGHDLPRLRRDADDRAQPLPDAVPVGADKAARLIARAIVARRRFYVLPWPMALVGRALRVLPRPLYDAVFARAPRKPRQP